MLPGMKLRLCYIVVGARGGWIYTLKEEEKKPTALHLDRSPAREERARFHLGRPLIAVGSSHLLEQRHISRLGRGFAWRCSRPAGTGSTSLIWRRCAAVASCGDYRCIKHAI